MATFDMFRAALLGRDPLVDGTRQIIVYSFVLILDDSKLRPVNLEG
jgi:hypothetical protein